MRRLASDVVAVNAPPTVLPQQWQPRFILLSRTYLAPHGRSRFGESEGGDCGAFGAHCPGCDYACRP
jgi:hypothetical protein